MQRPGGGSAACSDDDLPHIRAKILANFEKMVSPKREFFPEPEELEAHFTTILGESTHELTQRVAGKVKGLAMHGTTSDLALYTLGEDVRVVVIPTSGIFSTTPDEKLRDSVVCATVPGECDKSRVVCAVLQGPLRFGSPTFQRLSGRFPGRSGMGSCP